jgi:DtxR family Mn-dependent transcriptional regulator
MGVAIPVWYRTKILMSPESDSCVMQDYTGLELSPRKVEYLKYLSGQGGSAKISELSGHFGVDPSTATRTVQELTWEGFIHHEPYGDVVLTGFGEEYSAFLLRRHRILGLILSHYGLSDQEACEEASRIECFISRGAVNKMCRSLGHPTAGLCGEITHDALCRPEGTVANCHEKVS